MRVAGIAPHPHAQVRVVSDDDRHAERGGKGIADVGEAHRSDRASAVTGNSMPVMKRAASLARKSAAFATSSGVDIRPSGIVATILARFSGVSGAPRNCRSVRSRP